MWKLRFRWSTTGSARINKLVSKYDGQKHNFFGITISGKTRRKGKNWFVGRAQDCAMNAYFRFGTCKTCKCKHGFTMYEQRMSLKWKLRSPVGVVMAAVNEKKMGQSCKAWYIRTRQFASAFFRQWMSKRLMHKVRKCGRKYKPRYAGFFGNGE